MLIEKCICGSTDFKKSVFSSINLNTCINCGIIHQELDMTLDEYYNFYVNDYHEDFQKEKGLESYLSTERYNHDISISEKRLRRYSTYIEKGTRGLDIGCSNAAFVDYCNRSGIICYGLEPGSTAKHDMVINLPLLESNFGDEEFDFITYHDVLEHIPNFRPDLQETYRIMKRGAFLIIDFPDFFSDSGQHHWKRIEHLWMLTDKEVHNLLEEYGFSVVDYYKPIPGKFVVIAEKR